MKAYRLWISLELFLAGGLAALLLVRQLLLDLMYRLISASAQAEILNVLDHLLPYYFVYFFALVGVGVVTLVTWLWHLGGPRQADK